jgi:hypothetical protein
MMTTYGERLIAKLTKELDQNKQYYTYQEPTLSTRQSAYRNPDFVIIGAHMGVVVLEVKDWVTIRRGRQEEVEIERRNGEVEWERNPIKIAREYALNLSDMFYKRDELLRKYKGKNKLVFPWMYAVALPNIERRTIQQLESAGTWEAGCAFSREQLVEGRFENALKQLPWPWVLKSSLSRDVLDVIISVLTGEVVILDKEQRPVGVPTIRQIELIREPVKPAPPVKKIPLLDDTFLTSEAHSVVESMNVRLVRGVAGSGKSLVLARRAQYVAENYPELNVLIMAFNRHLVSDLKRRIPGANNLQIINFHQICRQIMGKEWHDVQEVEGWLKNKHGQFMADHSLSTDFVADEIEWRKELGLYDGNDYLNARREGREIPLSRGRREIINAIFDQYVQFQTESNIPDWSDVPLMALAMLQNDHPLRHSFDVILIDEAQDFAPSWVKIVQELLAPGGSLFLCDDPAQSLFRSFSWKAKGIDVVGRTRVLRVPFRCTHEITIAAHRLLDAINSTNDELTTPDLTTYELASGPKPKLISYPDLTQEIQFVRQDAFQLRDGGIAPAEIAILCHNKHLVRHWAALRDQGFYIESFYKMKGLEFRAVLIPHLNTILDHPDATRDEAFINEVRRKTFTAMTRARETLVMSYHGKFPAELAALEAHVQRENGAPYGRAK